MLAGVRPLTAGRPAAAGHARAGLRRGRGRADRRCPASTTPRWTGTPSGWPTSPAPPPSSRSTLPVVGEIGAGQARLRALAPGAAAKIMTGAPMPAGADAVVPYEWTDRGAAEVRIDQAPEPGQHIRPAGDDVAEGDLLVEDGTVLGPRQLGLLASVGRATVLARPRPRVVVLSTGSELREPGQRARPRLDLRRQLLPARRRRPPGRRDRLPRRHRPRRARPRSSRRCTTSWSAPTSSSPPAASPRATTTSSRRRCAARASGSARSRCSPGKPQGFGLVGERPGPDRHAARQPGVGVHLLRDVRAARDPHADGADARRPARSSTPGCTQGMTSPAGRRQFMRGQAGTDAQGRYVDAGGRPRLAPDRRPGRGQLPASWCPRRSPR